MWGGKNLKFSKNYNQTHTVIRQVHNPAIIENFLNKQEISPSLFIIQDCTKIISKPKLDIKLKTL